MPDFLFVYYGGMSGGTPAEQEKSMNAWTAWFQGMGKAVVEMGSPTKPGKTVRQSGVRATGGNGVSGYSVIRAASMGRAVSLAKRCPIIGEGGAVGIYETVPM